MPQTPTVNRRRDDHGLSLVELVVIVVIIAILLAVAVTSYLGARRRAEDRAAQVSLRLALTAAKAVHAEKQSYSDATENPATGLPKVEPSLTYAGADTESSRDNLVSVKAAASEWAAAVNSTSGTCFFIHETPEGTRYGTAGGGQRCTGTEARTATGSSY
ncbi:MAG: prepilin-type N-terminal cleavage/methylation domain-containing protein [Actinomycetota bacterium]|nr:prepilin-type N-terminal cleavage/methylation domain-containing protein [Actinomycetota bacterium]